MLNRYAISAAIIMLLVFLAYFVKFYVYLDYSLSNNQEIWAQLGDYAGGLLSPIFSFMSLILLIKSLTLQNESNRNLIQELENNKKTEKLRSFETIFFSMLKTQSELFSIFSIEFKAGTSSYKKEGPSAVIEIENKVEKMREEEKSHNEIKTFLEELDSTDQIFGISRAFYITTKFISDKLNNNEGFTKSDRKSHYQALVNFTDFSQLRLILISIQFMEFYSSEYLKNNTELNSVLLDLGIKDIQY